MPKSQKPKRTYDPTRGNGGKKSKGAGKSASPQELSCWKKFKRNVSDGIAERGATAVVYVVLFILFAPPAILGIVFMLKFLIYASTAFGVDAATVLSIATAVM